MQICHQTVNLHFQKKYLHFFSKLEIFKFEFEHLRHKQ